MILLWKLLHVLLAGLFVGALFAMLLVQSLLQRSLDDSERRSLARAASAVARLGVNPVAILAFLSGLVYWFNLFGRGASMATLMACTPVYVHIMLLLGLLAVGFAQAWKGQTRKLVAMLDAGKPAAEARKYITVGWTFAVLAFALVVVNFTVAELRVPNPPLMHCGGR